MIFSQLYAQLSSIGGLGGTMVSSSASSLSTGDHSSTNIEDIISEFGLLELAKL